MTPLQVVGAPLPNRSAHRIAWKPSARVRQLDEIEANIGGAFQVGRRRVSSPPCRSILHPSQATCLTRRRFACSRSVQDSRMRPSLALLAAAVLLCCSSHALGATSEPRGLALAQSTPLLHKV